MRSLIVAAIVAGAYAVWLSSLPVRNQAQPAELLQIWYTTDEGTFQTDSRDTSRSHRISEEQALFDVQSAKGAALAFLGDTVVLLRRNRLPQIITKQNVLRIYGGLSPDGKRMGYIGYERVRVHDPVIDYWERRKLEVGQIDLDSGSWQTLIDGPALTSQVQGLDLPSYRAKENIVIGDDLIYLSLASKEIAPNGDFSKTISMSLDPVSGSVDRIGEGEIVAAFAYGEILAIRDWLGFDSFDAYILDHGGQRIYLPEVTDICATQTKLGYVEAATGDLCIVDVTKSVSSLDQRIMMPSGVRGVAILEADE